MRILVVEDDELVAQVLTKILAEQNYAVEVATDGQAGWELIETYEYDLVLLDVILPKLDGIRLCKQLRSHNYQMPVLLLTGQDSGHDKAIGLDAGADDYVVKPFDVEELVARIRALLRRGGAIAQPILEWSHLQLDPTTCEVTWQGQLLSLTSKEYALLELFLRNNRRVFSCGMILEHLWSYETMPGEEAVRTHIKCLRQKFKAAGVPADLIETVYGIGYRLRTLTPVESEKNHLVTPPAIAKLVPSPHTKPSPPQSSPSAQQTLTAIATVWERFKGRVSDQVAVLEQAITCLTYESAIAPALLEQAQRDAHTLAGSLGTFGFTKGSQIARAIEQWLKSDLVLITQEVDRLQELVHLLRQEISQPAMTNDSPTMGIPQRLLIVDRDRSLMADLAAEATRWGLQTATVMNVRAAREQIAHHRPTIVLLDPSFSNDPEDGLSLLTELGQQHPPIPTLIFTAQNGLSDRLEVARLGGRTFLHKPVPVSQVLEVVQQTLQRVNPVEAHLLAVDDDPAILALLKSLLVPWGLQVDTLDDPCHFWDVLEATTPDLLILDVAMPQLNGLELCQIVRNDSRWSSLPILFLTAHTDADIINQIFAVGADDFVSKPIISSELVTRIINRLDRVKFLRNCSRIEPCH